MKTVKVFMLVIFFSILIIMSLLVFAEDSKQASDFQSNGDLIEGWYWLRDSALQNYAEWTFDNIPLGPEEITVQINALATDRPGGGEGFNAKFLLYYSLIGEGDMPLTYIPPQTVNLENVHSPDDSFGYSCQGQVTIPASTIPAASRISLRIRRDSAQDNHIAFKEDSIVLLTDATHPPNGEPSSNDDDCEGATPIQADTCTGSLGEEDAEGHRDDVDYYSIHLEEGQQITLQLTVPGNANYGISLLNPSRSSLGSSITQREIKTLDYEANSTGTWYIKISRSSGEGEYQLAIDIQDQNDAEKGQDAGDSYQGAILISPPGGTFTGLLKAGDDVDYYSIHLEEGQQITLQLTVPGNANYGISLLNPSRSSLGSSITQREIKTLDYVANSSGAWYIKISRTSGEGEYQLVVNSTSVGSGGEDNNPPPVISSLDANQDSIEINHDVDITCNASDQDGDTLTFSWTANGVSVGANDSYLTWRAPDTAGTYTITCTVSDGKGGEDSESVSITVTEPSNGGNDNDNIGEINYRIEITTGTRIAAGTDANVYITIYDKDGHDSGEILLDDPGVNDFERGDTNTFLVTAINIEDLDYIIVRHDSTGDYPGWYVDEIQVSNEEINQEWNFFPDQWLATDEPPDYQTQGRFYPEEEGTPGGNIEYILSLTNGGGTLNSNLPIFVNADEVGNLEIDSDGDGIRQQWEDKAMEYINPYIELDEEEPWLDNQDSDYVANYVRVHPYNPFSTSTTFNSANLPQYIIFRYVVTWSMDYGRQTVAGINLPFFTSHPTDRERIFMVWKVIDSNTLKLDWVFTSSHENPDAHHAVWNADHRTCNIGEISNLSKTFERTEVMCGNLQFSNDRLIVYASEGKHALYPSCDICENVMLVDGPGPLNVGEDCGGGGRFRFYCYNVGEPVRELPDCGFIDPKVNNLILSDEKLGGTLPDILVQKLEARYELKITTGNVDRGGTDARLDVTLYGDQGSKVFSIYTNPEPPRPALYIGTFEKENTDYIYVPSLDLGEINQIRIINDNSGDGPGWYVNNIEIKDIKTNKTWSYLPNVWISEDEQLDRTFTLTQQ